MGVRGLNTFTNNIPRIVDNNYHLHDTEVVIDSSNFMHGLMRPYGTETRYGGDMVAFAKGIREFYNNLKKCNIRPILVVDGADELENGEISKFETNLQRKREKFNLAIQYSANGGSDVLFPTIAISVFRSISIEMGAEIHQCMFEADPHIARLALKNKCPIISQDTDFYLFDLPHGVITKFDHRDIQTDSTNSKQYIKCSMYNQKRFKDYLPTLDTRCLPLVAVISGNDFSSAQKFSDFCYHLPAKLVCPQHVRSYTRQELKLNRIFCFLKGKSLQHNMDEICDQFPYYERDELRQSIKDLLKTYQIPKEDNFRAELTKYYRKGFYAENKELNQAELDSKLKRVVDQMTDWFKNAAEKSVLQHKCFDMMYRNTIFIPTPIEDLQLSSANCCTYRYTRVMLTLLRSSRTLKEDNEPCKVYDRIGYSYEKMHLEPIKELDGFGALDCIAYEVPCLTREKRKKILLATFYCDEPDSVRLSEYPEEVRWKVYELSILRQLFQFIDRESDEQAKLHREFKTGAEYCLIYYYSLDESNGSKPNFVSNLSKQIEDKKCTMTPSSRFDCRIVHQISQLQMSMISFNSLNAFLGDVMQRMKPENWLNGCLIYNLVKAIQNNNLTLS